MITKFSHTTLFVNDQDKAYDFYVNKLGFKVHTDAMMDNGYRWLTVNPSQQPDLEVVLMPVLHDSMVKSDSRRRCNVHYRLQGILRRAKVKRSYHHRTQRTVLWVRMCGKGWLRQLV